MRAADVPEIRSLPLFSGMSDENFEALVRGGYVQNFPPQIELIREGDPSDFLHILIEGTIELFAKWNDRETTMVTVPPLSTFILAATIRNAPYLMSARTVTKARLILVPSSDVREVFEADNAFARAVVIELAHRYRSLVRHAKNIKLRTSIERLANYLLQQYRQNGESSDFELGMEKRRLASYLGMTPENLSRAFRNLEAYGVEVTGSTIRIVDARDLIRLAKPTELIDGEVN